MIILLECLRISRDNDKITLPKMVLFKSKRSKKEFDMDKHVESAIYDLMDKVLIWSFTEQPTELNSIFKQFISPIVIAL